MSCTVLSQVDKNRNGSSTPLLKDEIREPGRIASFGSWLNPPEDRMRDCVSTYRVEFNLEISVPIDLEGVSLLFSMLTKILCLPKIELHMRLLVPTEIFLHKLAFQ